MQKDTERLKILELQYYFIMENCIFTHNKHSRTISYTGGANKEIVVVLYDVTGKEHYSKVILTTTSGQSIYALDIQNKLSAGIYFVTATSNNKILKKKIIVQ